MALPQTEAPHEAATGLDARSDRGILAVLLAGQAQAIASVDDSLQQIGAGAALMAKTVKSGGRLIYSAAGSSGLMAMADAAELGGTFGIPHEQIVILMAGGLPIDARMPGGSEDDVEDAERAAQDVLSGDLVIAISASGTTAYPSTIARIARTRGAHVICIANNVAAPIFDHADVAICVPTPPEVISGSTRMGAGTAQKAVLNMMSTLMGIRLGHVHDGMMVNLVADNDKLRSRAAGIVSRIAGVDVEAAKTCLMRANGVVKPAVLLAAGATQNEAEQILNETRGHLRAAMARV